ncbi:hypothetical protein NQ314_009916 [Rhamnusium bicolor]|uniref:MADF domain-containing protein n=1 Tax=Rhamnusium bicolor TaxID=1586634 RepID=A0AAV8XWJ0_9CUCU|nr:hypothetical protein NQ314_009916 [Rhamnusium bicolor]
MSSFCSSIIIMPTEIKLVGEIEKHECLYNYKLAEYSRKDVTEKAWREVATKTNLSGKEYMFLLICKVIHNNYIAMEEVYEVL